MKPRLPLAKWLARAVMSSHVTCEGIHFPRAHLRLVELQLLWEACVSHFCTLLLGHNSPWGSTELLLPPVRLHAAQTSLNTTSGLTLSSKVSIAVSSDGAAIIFKGETQSMEALPLETSLY